MKNRRYAGGMFFIGPILQALTIGAGVIGGLLAVFALADAGLRRADAFVAVDRQTKPTWLAILALSALPLVLGAIPGWMILIPPNILWLAGLIGVLVYLVDVRPATRDAISGGGRY